jgi:hypothetical protein
MSPGSWKISKQLVLVLVFENLPGKVLAVLSANASGWRWLVPAETIAPHLKQSIYEEG